MTTIVMTGTPTDYLTKDEVAKMARAQGLAVDSNVTAKRTDILVYNPFEPRTTKIRRAEDLTLRGLANIRMITYRQLFQMLNRLNVQHEMAARRTQIVAHA